MPPPTSPPTSSAGSVVATTSPRPSPSASKLDESVPLLRVADLAVSFENGKGPRIQAVDGVRMTIYPRQTLAVVGESGCGKSVTAMSTMQLVPRPPGRFDRGAAFFNHKGKSINLLTLSEREMQQFRGSEIAMIFQEPMTSLNPVYTIGDQILEAILLHQHVKPEEAIEIASNNERLPLPGRGSR